MSERDRGSATLEFALALPAMVCVLALALTCVAWALGASRAQSAAAHGARVAIVEPDATALAAAAHIGHVAPSNVRLHRSGAWVTVCVDVPSTPPIPAGSRCATAFDEP